MTIYKTNSNGWVNTSSMLNDLLWRNFMLNDQSWKLTSQSKFEYPVDIYGDSDGIHFELAVNCSKKDLEITADNKTLRITNKNRETVEEDKDRKYLHRGISRKKFDLAWEISPNYDLSGLEASLNEGILQIDIPFSEEATPKKVKIN